MANAQRVTAYGLTVLASFVLWGCNSIPTSGPHARDVEQAVAPAQSGIQVVDVDDNVARRLLALRAQPQFADALGTGSSKPVTVGSGDGLEVTLWEAPPATLFGASLPEVRGAAAAPGVRATVLPEQIVNAEGFISVPFAGKIRAGGRTMQEIEADIVKRLTGKANQPEAIVRLTRNSSSTVSVVGEVAQSVRLPLTPGNERLLDALAATGGVRQPVNKMTLQVTRGNQVFAMPLDAIIRDPRQNVRLQAGDVVTALFQPLSFTALGATGKNEEVPFEAQGITLAQALARVGGLQDARADARGVFLFRFEDATALNWPTPPTRTTADNKVAVIYRIDLKNPASFFVMQNFAVNNKDVLYVSNAPAAELQKFLNVIFSVAYPVLTVTQATR